MITLGSAVSGYLTFALAGVANGDVIDYAIKDGSNSENGTGTYTSSGTTLTRTVTKSTNSNSVISLSGTAEVFISPRAETLNDASLITTGTMATARLGSGTASSTTALFGDQTYKTITVNGYVSSSYFTSTSANFTIPAAVTRGIVRMAGAGGASGKGNGAAGSGPGGGGAYLTKLLTGLVAGSTLTATIGAGGVGGSGTGGTGGSTTLASGTTGTVQTISTLTCPGGLGGGIPTTSCCIVHAGIPGAGGAVATGGDENFKGMYPPLEAIGSAVAASAFNKIGGYFPAAVGTAGDTACGVWRDDNKRKRCERWGRLHHHRLVLLREI